MNPFTFSYSSPSSSPATKYTYTFPFNPVQYDWTLTDSYTVRRVTYDAVGHVVQDIVFPSPFSGAHVFDTAATGTYTPAYGTGLKASHFDAFYFDKQ